MKLTCLRVCLANSCAAAVVVVVVVVVVMDILSRNIK